MDELQKLYDVLKRDGYYTKSFDEFVAKWEDDAYRDKVYQVVSRDGLYTKDKESFLTKYSSTPQQPTQQPDQQPVVQPTVKKKDDMESDWLFGDGSSESEPSKTEPDTDIISRAQKVIGIKEPQQKQVGEYDPNAYIEGVAKPKEPVIYSKPSTPFRNIEGGYADVQNQLAEIDKKIAESSPYEASLLVLDRNKLLLRKKEIEDSPVRTSDNRPFDITAPKFLEDGLNALTPKQLASYGAKGAKETFDYYFKDAGFKFETDREYVKAISPDGREYTYNTLYPSRESLDEFKNFVRESAFNNPEIADKAYLYEKENKKFKTKEDISNEVKTINAQEEQFMGDYKKFLNLQRDINEIEADLKRFRDFGEQNTPKYIQTEAYLNERKKELQDYAGTIKEKAVGLEAQQTQLDKAVGKYTEFQATQGDFGGNVYRTITNTISGNFSQFLRLAVGKTIDVTPMSYLLGEENYQSQRDIRLKEKGYKDEKVVPISVLNEIDDEIREEFKKTAISGKIGDKKLDNILSVQGVRQAISETLNAPITTTDEYLRERQEKGSWIERGLLGLSGSLPAMVGGPAMRYINMYLMNTDAAMQEMDNNPNFANISENEKQLVALPIGVVSAALEEIGLKNLKLGKSITSGIIKTVIGRVPAGASASAIRNTTFDVVAEMGIKGTSAYVGGLLSEAETGILQQASEYAIKDIYESKWFRNRDMFDNPAFLSGQYIYDLYDSGRTELVGAGIMSVPYSIAAAYQKDGFRALDDATFKIFEDLAKDNDSRKFFVTSLKNKINLGEVTPTQGKQMLEAYDQASGMIGMVPDEITDPESRKVAMDLMSERIRLEKQKYGKDEALAKPIQNKINQINEQLTQLTEDAIQKQTTGEVSVQPEAGAGQEVEVGGPEAKPKITPEESKRKEDLVAALQATDKDVIAIGDELLDRKEAQAEIEAITQKEQASVTEGAGMEQAPAKGAVEKKDIQVYRGTSTGNKSDKDGVFYHTTDRGYAAFYETGKEKPENKALEELEALTPPNKPNKVELSTEEEVDAYVDEWISDYEDAKRFKPETKIPSREEAISEMKQSGYPIFLTQEEVDNENKKQEKKYNSDLEKYNQRKLELEDKARNYLSPKKISGNFFNLGIDFSKMNPQQIFEKLKSLGISSEFKGGNFLDNYHSDLTEYARKNNIDFYDGITGGVQGSMNFAPQEILEISKIEQAATTTEATPVEQQFTEQDRARKAELEEAMRKADKRRKNITVGEVSMPKAEAKAELDALNQKEQAAQQPVIPTATAPTATAPVETMTAEQEADLLEELMTGKKKETAPTTPTAVPVVTETVTEAAPVVEKVVPVKEEATVQLETAPVAEEKLEIILGGLNDGYKAISKNSFDVRSDNSIMDEVSNQKSFAKITTRKGKKYAVVGLALETKRPSSTVGRDNYSFAMVEMNESTPNNIIEILEQNAKENFKNIYRDFSENDVVKPITTKDAGLPTAEVKAEPTSLADAVRKNLTIKTGGLQSNILGVPIAIWNAGVETMAKAIEAGVAINKAVQKAIEYIKENHGKKFNEASVEKKLLIGQYKGAIEIAREAKVTNEGLKTYFKRQGLTDAQIETLLKVKEKAEKKPISKEKVIGKPKPKKVTVNEMTALKDQLRLEAKAAREAKGDLNAKRKMLTAAIKEMKKKGSISVRQAKALINRVNAVNLDNPVMVERLLDYADKVFNDAAYAEKLSKANKLQSQIKQLSKNKDKFGNLTAFAAEFAKIDPAMVENIDEYLEMASKVKEGVQGSKIVGDKVIPADMVDVGATIEYVNKTMEAQEEAIRLKTAERLKELMGVDVSDLSMEKLQELMDLVKAEVLAQGEQKEKLSDKINEIFGTNKDKEKAIRDGIQRMFDTYSTIIKDMFDTGIDPFSDPENPTTVEFKDSDKKIVEEFMDMDLSLLDKKEALRAADALNNFLTNKSTAGMLATLGDYNGRKNVREVVKEGKKAHRIKMYWSPILGRTFFQQIASIPAFFERLFKSYKTGRYIREMMGINSLINHKQDAVAAVNRIINNYILEFSKKTPNNKNFQDISNIIERDMIGSLGKTIVGNAKQVEAEFNRRKKLIEQSIQVLEESGTKKELELAKTMKEVYDKIVKDSKTIEEVKAKADKINVDAVQFWINTWANVYDQLADVTLNVYNRVLDKNINFVPDRFGFVEGADKKSKDADGFGSTFLANSNSEYFYKKEAGSLMKSTPPQSLLDEDGESKGMYVDMSFDTKNANALMDALIDIKTAADIRQIQAFVSDSKFKKIFPFAEDATATKERIAALIRNFRNKRAITDKSLKAMVRKMDRIAAIGTSLLLAGPTQAISQTIPVAINTIINSGGKLNLSNINNKDVNRFIDESGMGIANRGSDAVTELETLNQKLEVAAKTKAGAVAKYIENLNREYLKIYLSNFDVFIARASWITYYEKGLRKQGIKGKVDYSKDKLNKEAAQYAQDMIDRQQNISDKDLAGQLYQSDNPVKQFIVKVVMPLATFRMNQTTRFSNDLAIFTSKTASIQEKKEAALSIGGFAAEMATFRAIKLYIGYYVFDSLAQMIRGEEDDEEEKQKTWDNMVRGAATSVVSDVFSPIPMTDVPTKILFAGVLDQLQNIAGVGEDDKFNIFTESKSSFTSDWGLLGVGIDKMIKLGEKVELARTGKFKDDFGNEKTISESDRALLSNPLYIGINVATVLGINPFAPETDNVMNRITKMAKKNAMSNEQLKEAEELGVEGKKDLMKVKADKKAEKEEAYGGYETLKEFEEKEPEKFDEYSAPGGKLDKYREQERKEDEEKNKDEPFRGLSENKFKELYPVEWAKKYGPGTAYFQRQNSPAMLQKKAQDKMREAQREQKRKMAEAKRRQQEILKKASGK